MQELGIVVNSYVEWRQVYVCRHGLYTMHAYALQFAKSATPPDIHLEKSQYTLLLYIAAALPCGVHMQSVKHGFSVNFHFSFRSYHLDGLVDVYLILDLYPSPITS